MAKQPTSSNINPFIYFVGFCAIFSLLWSLVSLLGLLVPLLRVGLPLIVCGWGWQGRQQAERRRQAALDCVFYRLLQTQQGYISALDLAMAAKLPPEAARPYLDRRAKEFVAQFGIGETGEVFYIFPVQFHSGRSVYQKSTKRARLHRLRNC